MSAEIKVTRPLLNCIGDKTILETFRAAFKSWNFPCVRYHWKSRY